jgi:CBS domain-containing protein
VLARQLLFNRANSAGEELDMKALDIMKSDVFVLDPHMPLGVASNLLQTHKISGAPVVDRQQRLIGILSQSDLLRVAFGDSSPRFESDTFYTDLPFGFEVFMPAESQTLNGLTVERCMSPEVITCRPEDGIASVASKMRYHCIHRIIVCENEKVAGIITTMDLLGILENQ